MLDLNATISYNPEEFDSTDYPYYQNKELINRVRPIAQRMMRIMSKSKESSLDIRSDRFEDDYSTKI